MQWLLMKAGVQAFDVGHRWQLCYLESSGFLSIILSWGFPGGAEVLLGAYPQDVAKKLKWSNPR